MLYSFFIIIFFIPLFLQAKTLENEVVPLPSRSVWSQTGIQGNLGLGSYSAKNCDDLVQWRGGAHYQYKSFVSGGLDIRLTGGGVGTDNVISSNRYTVNAKFFGGEGGLKYYLAPLFGLTIVSLDTSNLFQSLSQKNNSTEDVCAELENNQGVSLGFETGGAYKVLSALYLTSSLKTEWNSSFFWTNEMQLGVAFAVHEKWSKARKRLKGVVLFAEYYIVTTTTEVIHFPLFGVSFLF